MQGGLFSCSLPLDAIINGRERRAGEPIRSLLACQPKTNCLLALTAGFYLHNSNPKAKAICTWSTPTGGAVFTHRHMRGEDGEWWCGEREREREGGGNAGSNRTAAESIAVTLSSRHNTSAEPISRTLRGYETLVAPACSACFFFFFFLTNRGVFP